MDRTQSTAQHFARFVTIMVREITLLPCFCSATMLVREIIYYVCKMASTNTNSNR